ncbi:Ionotropic receptor 138 [Hyalella azteca]|uniref:Ionotropic receptor 138 n=1 Tax=Hyalella azteca TaxID=294128 RepID=A0A6A0GTT7_HYAAZ|nr:Ionotropic receptor 138 [Hyalella azteca]
MRAFGNGTDPSVPPYWDLLLKSPHTFRFPEAVELTVAAEEWVPHIAVREDPVNGIVISGPMANLLDALARAMNFKYKIVRPADGAWGIPRPDGSGDWNGMIGMVKRKEADLALGPFGLTFSRSRVVSFTSPILIDYYRILVRRLKPQPDPWGWRNPFTLGVWISFVVSMLALALALCGNTRLFGISHVNHNETPCKSLSFSEHCWLLFGTSLSQRTNWMPFSLGGRFVLAIWLLIALIATRSYSSSLTSLLAVRTIATPYNYLKDLVNDHHVKLVFEAATALVEHMSTVKTGIYADLAKQSDRSRFVTPPQLYEAAYSDVRTSDTALLVEDTTCRKVLSDDFTKTGRCDFYIGKERYWPLIFCMIVRKDHPIIGAINARLERFTSQDLYMRWLGEQLPNVTACSAAASKVTVQEPYSLRGLWGVFVLLTVGLALSSTCLALEVIIAKRWPPV